MKYRLQAIIFVFVAFMLGCNEYMIVGVLPDIAHEYHDSLGKLGLLVTVFALVYAIFTPIITSMANRWRRHHVLLVLMVIFFIGNTWTAMAPNFISMLLSRILTAGVAGAIISMVLVMASYVAPHEKRASLVSWVFAGFSIASVIGIPIGTVISTTLTWHDSFWMISGITIIVFVALIGSSHVIRLNLRAPLVNSLCYLRIHELFSVLVSLLLFVRLTTQFIPIFVL